MARTSDSLRMHCRTCGLRWKIFQEHQTMDEMCHVNQAFSSRKVACCQGYNKGPYRQEQVQAHLPADAFHIQLWMPLLLRELVLALLQNSQLVMSILFYSRAVLLIIFPSATFQKARAGNERTKKPPGNEYPSVQYA